jgi:cytochrome c biogenesis protein CcdA
VAGIVVLVISIAALDSLNPSTVIPAVVLALGPSAPRRLLAFTTGVFLVSTLGGIVLLFAVGRPLLTRLSHPSPHTRHVLELAVGIGLVGIATVLWRLRARLHTALDGTRPGRRSAVALGAVIMAIELPTAVPYFAAILATVEGVRGVVPEVVVVLAYNAVFVAPLLGVLVLAAKTDREHLTRASALVRRWAPVAVPAGVGVIGIVLATLGGSRL